jgi:hypothetical protein
VRTFRLASVHYPAGISWLLNCLVELNVCIYRGDSVSDVWDLGSSGSYTLAKEGDSISSFVPSINFGEKYIFDPSVCVQFSHDLPREKDLKIPTIVFNRDPRDALYSQFKRKQDSEGAALSYLDYLNELDPVYCLTPLETWNLFYWSWSRVDEGLFLDFEDRDLLAQQMLTRVCKFLGISRSSHEITSAVERSSFTKSKLVEAQNPQANKLLSYVHHRSGQAGEWRKNPESKSGAFIINTTMGIESDNSRPTLPDIGVIDNLSLFVFHPKFKAHSEIYRGELLIDTRPTRAKHSSLPLLVKAISSELGKVPVGSQTNLDLYALGIKLGIRNLSSSLLIISVHSLLREVFAAIGRRMQGPK